MKNRVLMLLLAMSMLLLTACSVHSRLELTIDPEQNVSMKYLYALDNELIDMMIQNSESSGDSEELEDISEEVPTEEKTYSDEERWQYLDENILTEYEEFESEKYSEGEYKGYIFTRDLGTIDDISADEYPGEIAFDELASQNIFFIKNGNEYTINLKAETTSEDIEIEDSDAEVESENIQELVITLPQKAKSHNATTVSEDGLTYTWDLLKVKSVELTYEINQSEEISEEPTQETTNEQTIAWNNASEWAVEELNKANALNIIPQILNGQDLTQNITRKEFAHIAVKLWEKVSGQTVVAGPKNPFSDTEDPEVLKAYNLEITNGTSDTTFEPDALITREQMATMMTRALAKAGVDTSVVLENAVQFADDAEMHDWGKTAIYYMSGIEIIKGVGDNTFNVNGNATREQALLISVRSAEKFSK